MADDMHDNAKCFYCGGKLRRISIWVHDASEGGMWMTPHEPQPIRGSIRVTDVGYDPRDITGMPGMGTE